MRIVYFTHSLLSCWNHGNAHFQRGLLWELAARGHEVVACEPIGGWSRRNLAADHGEDPLERARAQLPGIRSECYAAGADLVPLVHGADLVIVHEWTDPAIVAAIGRLRVRGARFMLLFHDTHHRAVSDPDAMRAFDLSAYDGVLAFGESLAEVYRRAGWGTRAVVFHEAADTRMFRPPPGEPPRDGVVWIGNWGDGERTGEIREFLLEPARAAGLALHVHGVRYPPEALALLERHGATWHGWISNLDVPEAFARHSLTVHVPRRLYRTSLPGIPTIRVFEALASGIPLVCAPWEDAEGLFRPGQDFLVAADGRSMRQHMRAVVEDSGLARSLIESGLHSIRARHTCVHRADQLLDIVRRLSPALAEAI